MRHVLALVSGTAISQVIAMAFTPLLTRLYGPEAFGLQGLFISMSSIVATVAALTYPTAIVLAETDSDAMGIARLSMCIGFATSALTAFVLWIWGSAILTFLGAEQIVAFMYLIPISMIVGVVGGIASQLLTRKKTFLLIARITILQAGIVNFIKGGLGLASPSAMSLISTNVIGGLLSATMMFLGVRGKGVKKKIGETETARKSTLVLAKMYYDFPLLRAPQVFLNTVSQSLPVIVLATYFGPTAVGFYSIAFTILGMPTALVGSSVMQVLYPRLSEGVRNSENISALIKKATKGLIAVGLPPFVIVIIFGPELFELILGVGWRSAGVYAQWLAVWLFFQFINKPAVAAIPALRLQRGLLYYEMLSTSTKFLSLYVGYEFFGSEIIAIGIFSIGGAVMYAGLIIWVIYSCGNTLGGNYAEQTGG